MKRNSTFLRSAMVAGVLLLGGSVHAAFAADDIVLYAKDATTVTGAWSRVSDSTAAGGARMANPDAGAAKKSTAMASPTSYFDIPFTVQPGVAYHLWVRSKAQNDSWQNDSMFVQFSGSTTASGSAVNRIGTSSALMVSLEEDSGLGESGWGWQDDGYGYNVLGDPIYFTGTSQVIRVQVREDGISVDQIVLSPATYFAKSPGAAKNDTKILPASSGGSTTTTTTAPTGNGVAWVNSVNAAASGSSIKKTNGCSGCYDAGAVSQQQISSGSVSFTVPTSQHLFVGLTHDPGAVAAYTAIDYSFKFNGGNAFEIREKNVYRTEGTFAAGDVFTIKVNGLTVTYYRNGTAVYTSKTPAPGPMAVNTSISNLSGLVSDANISGSTTTSTPVTTPDPTPAPAPSSPPPPTAPTGDAAALRVLQWNTHHGGYGTDGVYSPDRVATWAAKFKPDVVMFNEIEKNDYWGNQDQPEVYKALLQQKTGKTWYYVFAQEFGNWSSSGKGNLILSTYPINVSDRYELVHNSDRSIAMGVITVNGRDITLISTHLDPYDQSLRLTQAKEVTGWAASQPENRIITGDMNAWPDQTSIGQYNTLYYDSWSVAQSNGTATAFSGNSGETKNGRIDYIFYSKKSSNLKVVSSQVYDTRDSRGVMPSDHRPVLTTFEVR